MPGKQPVLFFFDFSSPYSWIAATRIDQVCATHGREVTWLPIPVGVAMKMTGARPLTEGAPARAGYFRRDFARSAREHGLPFSFPHLFPVSPVPASRAFYWLGTRAPELARPFARAIFHAFFALDRDISDSNVVCETGHSLGIDPGDMAAGIDSGAARQRLRETTADAIEQKGVFGVPFFLADGEPFWGADRIDTLGRWLASGGW